MRAPLTLVVALSVVAGLAAQTPSAPAGPVFDVVSIRPSPPIDPAFLPSFNNNFRPDGGFTLKRVPAVLLIMNSYPGVAMLPADVVGLPDWATRDLYDVSATSSLTRARLEERAAMTRAMMADRFKLVAHLEPRPQQVIELTVARADGRLGSGLTPIQVDCEAQNAARRAEVQAALNEGRQPPRPDLTKPPGPCELRSVTGRPIVREHGTSVMPPTRVEGEGAFASIVQLLRGPVGRPIVDKTGLTGSYRIALEFDMMASRRGPDLIPNADSGPTIFAAVQEQLGLKLQSVTTPRDTIVVDRIERPTEN
jgi:uncharacterized protein (TIGR03435 family)